MNSMEEYDFHSVSSKFNEKYILNPLLDGVPYTLEFDTGPAVSSVSLLEFKRFSPSKSITEVPNIKLKHIQVRQLIYVG